MNYKLKVILFFLMLEVFSFRAYSKDRRLEHLEVLNQQIQEIKRLNKQSKYRNPVYLIRQAEFYVEKSRFVREIKNDEFLSIPPEQRRRINKKNFFKNANHLLEEAQKICKFVLKRFINFRAKGDVYSIMAHNAKEAGKSSEAKRYLKNSIKYSKRKSKTIYKSRKQLAEIFYNEQQYYQAIKLYESSLPFFKSRWWTQDNHNLAWSYFRIKKYNKAISTLERIYRYKGDQKYIDVSRLVERDIGYFYVAANRTDDAVIFYKRIGGNIAKHFVKLAKYLLDKGKYSVAEKVLLEALKVVDADKEKIDVIFDLVNLYSKGRYSKHLATCKKLMVYQRKGMLESQQSDLLRFQIQKAGAILQKQVVSKRYKHDKLKNKLKARMAVDYFKLLIELVSDNNYEFMFHIAETYYAISNYSNALKYYKLSLEASKNKTQSKFEKMSLNGILVILGKKSLSKKLKNKYLVYSYEEFLKNNPRGKKSLLIYQRLFSAYFDKNKIDDSERVLFNFRKYFPRKFSKQEAMLAKIMDYYKNKNNRSKVNEWIDRIDRKQFVVSRKYSKKLKQLQINMQFAKVEKATSNGDKKSALLGYIEIYEDIDSNAYAKKNAAYNIAVLFHELGAPKKTYLWAKKALARMNAKDSIAFKESFMVIGSELFNRRYFSEASDIYSSMFIKLCRTKEYSAQKKFFKNANVIYVAENQLEKSEYLIGKSLKCKIRVKNIKDAQYDLLNEYMSTKRWESFVRTVKHLEKSKRMWPKLIYPLSKLEIAYNELGNSDLSKRIRKKIINYYDYSKMKKYNIPLEALNVYASYKINDLYLDFNKFDRINPRFPEKRFNKLLKKKFEKLEILTSKAMKILSIGSGIGIIATYDLLAKRYSSFSSEILKYKAIGKSKEYSKSFRKGMSSISKQIEMKAKSYIGDGKKQILKNDILSILNKNFFIPSKNNDVEYIIMHKGVVMDRGGVR